MGTKHSSTTEANDKNKVIVKKDVQSEVPPRKKQPNQYTKRKDELQKNGNNSTEKDTSTKYPSNNNSSKSGMGTNSVKSKEYDELKSETYSSKSVEIVQTVTGKRKRKPKKFWDEAEVKSPTTSP